MEGYVTWSIDLIVGFTVRIAVVIRSL
ncbi:Uncharacterized protein HZ326_20536, partial [Fusarium oxysporum f. sp. albedinis]